MTNVPKTIILHCADTPDSGDQFSIEHVNRWHRENQWKPYVASDGREIYCGYHYLIKRSGVVEIGRPETAEGIHTKGYNQDSLGIMYFGTRKMTEMQLNSFLRLYKQIYSRHQIEPENVFGHYEFNEHKPCPGQDMIVIRALLKLHLAIGFKNI